MRERPSAVQTDLGSRSEPGSSRLTRRKKEYIPDIRDLYSSDTRKAWKIPSTAESSPADELPSDLPRDDLGRVLLGPFRLMARLGSGGMGVVYRGVEETTGREVAVKVIRTNRLAMTTEQERFRAEIAILSRLRHHHICPLLTFGTRARSTTW